MSVNMWESEFQLYVWVSVVVVSCVLSTAVALISCYRYLVSMIAESNALPFHLLGSILGIPVKVASNPTDVRHMLNTSNVKGEFLERRVACAAWLPVISIESVDGPTYEVLRQNFDLVYGTLPHKDVFQRIARAGVSKVLEERQQSESAVIDSDDINTMVASIFWEYLFGKPPDNVMLITAAANDWRREIAARGPKNLALRRRFVQYLVQTIKCNAHYRALFDDISVWDQPELYSVLAQPLIISPIINFSDLAVAIKTDTVNQDATPVDMLKRNHPFPILERYCSATHHQRVAFAGPVGTPCPWPVFGAGDRKCPGQGLAMILLTEMMRFRGVSNFHPEVGHRHSGRNNDSRFTLGEFVSLVFTLVRVCVGAIWERIFRFNRSSNVDKEHGE
eukprot:m.746162 g.746162  ORF g.746162 m.746162 type:complete len:392 (+) comp23133_c0_seq4:145-1320(+)